MVGGERHTLNPINIPGHVNFTYKVLRSLAACEGALLVVHALQGNEAQTYANVYLALQNDLDIILFTIVEEILHQKLPSLYSLPHTVTLSILSE